MLVEVVEEEEVEEVVEVDDLTEVDEVVEVVDVVDLVVVVVVVDDTTTGAGVVDVDVVLQFGRVGTTGQLLLPESAKPAATQTLH